MTSDFCVQANDINDINSFGDYWFLCSERANSCLLQNIHCFYLDVRFVLDNILLNCIAATSILVCMAFSTIHDDIIFLDTHDGGINWFIEAEGTTSNIVRGFFGELLVFFFSILISEGDVSMLNCCTVASEIF